jgi:hypothetical protein
MSHVENRGKGTVYRSRGVAGVTDFVDPGQITQQIFVDRSGRRRRWMGWVAALVALLGVLFAAALWLSQAATVKPADVVPCKQAATAPAGNASPPAGRCPGGAR